MNKKTKIQIAIIVTMFASSGLVLYLGFGRQAATPPPLPLSGTAGSPIATTPGSSGSNALLPYGDKLEFSVINDSRFNYDTNKISVEGDNEVGVVPENMIRINPTK